MNLFVPEIGSKLKLTNDWVFILYREYRNKDLAKKLGLSPDKNNQITIPTGTILTVKRVYIRQGLSQYSSLTFGIPKKSSPKELLWSTKFWASLNDVNQIEFELLECNEDVLRSVQNSLNLIKEKVSNPSTYKSIERVILESGSINTFRPIEDGYTFFRKALLRLEHHLRDKYSKELEDAKNIISGTFRKYKIEKLEEEFNEEELD